MRKYFCLLSIALLLIDQILVWGIDSKIYDAEKDIVADVLQRTSTEGYDQAFVDLVEMIYGEGFLSQGGKEAVDRMVSGIDLTGCKVLDIGSGLGAPALRLAEQYALEVIGIDPLEWMVARANQLLKEKHQHLRGIVMFLIIENPHHLKQFPDETFDVVFSKESILHIPHDKKMAYFQEIHRVLKTGGQILIMDWAHRSPEYSANTKKMMEMDGVAFYLNTPEEYQALLQQAGFTNISMTNLLSEQQFLSQQNLDTIEELALPIQERFGMNTYEYCIKSWGYQRDAFASQELIAALFKAKKEPKVSLSGEKVREQAQPQY